MEILLKEFLKKNPDVSLEKYNAKMWYDKTTKYFVTYYSRNGNNVHFKGDFDGALRMFLGGVE